MPAKKNPPKKEAQPKAARKKDAQPKAARKKDAQPKAARKRARVPATHTGREVWSPPDLRGQVAVVTGASRGAGRGIALVLGETGATVYVTGRSVRGGPTTNNRPETIEETAEAVTSRGGAGIPVRCDHTVDEEIEALFQRVRREQGRIDILVNNAWGGYEMVLDFSPFWDIPLRHWDLMFTAGVRSHMVTSRLGLPLMLRQRQGMIINTTAFFGGATYQGNLFYHVAKNAVNQMTYCMAEDLRTYKIPVIALAPGWMRTERMDLTPKQKLKTHSPEYVGRAVVALATDPKLMDKSGRVLQVADVAREYGFADIDGRQVPPLRELFPDVFLD